MLEMYAYHVTPIENLESIKANGLLPRIGERSVEYGESKEGIYLFGKASDLEAALSSWMETVFDPEEPLVCLLVDIAGLEQRSDAGYEICVLEPIPPKHIKVLSLDIWAETTIPASEMDLGHMDSLDNIF